MAIPSVNAMKKYQVGVSFIELMIASSMGIVVLIAVGSVFLSGQKRVTERMQRLLVMKSINEALRYIKEDIQRAGFNGSNSQSFILSGADSVVKTTSTSLAYGYQTSVIDGMSQYTQVSFIYRGNELRVCERADARTQSFIPCGTSSNPSFSLFDANRIKVNHFSIEKQTLGSTVGSAIYTITLSASLKDGSYLQTMSTHVKQRNWK